VPKLKLLRIIKNNKKIQNQMKIEKTDYIKYSDLSYVDALVYIPVSYNVNKVECETISKLRIDVKGKLHAVSINNLLKDYAGSLVRISFYFRNHFQLPVKCQYIYNYCLRTFRKRIKIPMFNNDKFQNNGRIKIPMFCDSISNIRIVFSGSSSTFTIKDSLNNIESKRLVLVSNNPLTTFKIINSFNDTQFDDFRIYINSCELYNSFKYSSCKDNNVNAIFRKDIKQILRDKFNDKIIIKDKPRDWHYIDE
jgi:hypothetical protein